MDLEELEKVQSTKPQIIVDSGFASNIQDTLGKLREFALGFSSSKVTEVSQSPDLHIIQAINSLDEIDKIANGLSSRLREWYGLHFPELDNMIDSINGYAQIVMAGKRESLSKQVFEEAGFPESKVEMLSLILSKSRGGDISDINLSIVQSIAKQILEIIIPASTLPFAFIPASITLHFNGPFNTSMLSLFFFSTNSSTSGLVRSLILILFFINYFQFRQEN